MSVDGVQIRRVGSARAQGTVRSAHGATRVGARPRPLGAGEATTVAQQERGEAVSGAEQVGAASPDAPPMARRPMCELSHRGHGWCEAGIKRAVVRRRPISSNSPRHVQGAAAGINAAQVFSPFIHHKSWVVWKRSRTPNNPGSRSQLRLLGSLVRTNALPRVGDAERCIPSGRIGQTRDQRSNPSQVLCG